MTPSTLERLAYIAAHKLLNLQSQDSAIFGKQYATAGMRRTVAIDRIASVIAETFDGVEQAELASMMHPLARWRAGRVDDAAELARLSAEFEAGESE